MKVEPIRDYEKVQRCYAIARAHDMREKRHDTLSWELLMVVGFNTGLRISDLSRLRVGDLLDEHVRVVAKKTKKYHRIEINPAARKAVRRLLKGRDPDEWAFPSRQLDKNSRLPRHITRQRAYQIMNAIARKAGVRDRIGCHTLRKTFGYHFYKETGDVVSTQRVLGHDARRDTLMYIGIRDDEVDASMKRFKLVYDGET